MKIGIVCASDDELAPFLSEIDNCRITERAMLKFCEGWIHDMEVVVLFSGVCRVNAAIATQILIDIFGVNIILNSGAAGGMDPRLAIFDTVISTEVCYHDVAEDVLTQFHPWMKSVFFQADEQEGIYNAKLDLEQLRRYRENEVHGNCHRRPKKYGLLMDTKIEEPFIRENYRA